MKEPSTNNSWVDGLRVRTKVSPDYELAPENPGGVGAGVCMGKFFKLTLTREEFSGRAAQSRTGLGRRGHGYFRDALGR